MIGYLSRGIDEIQHLSVFLGKECRYIKKDRKLRYEAVVGWGRKSWALKAKKYARRKRLPYISIEDGYLRSLGLGIQGATQHSLIIDYSGIYYDATSENDLENFIFSASNLSIDELSRAGHCIGLIRKHRLSKYNQSPEKKIEVSNGRPSVLVVDQTKGDASIKFGMAESSSFLEMLASAIDENPDSEIIVKLHPDAIKGKRKGHLHEAAKANNCRIISEDVNPWSVIDAVDRVYVVTSQLGFEALMAGKKVTCFGMPFYAGWGLTDDRQSCGRRGVARSLEQLFFSAYIQYARYINPYIGESCQLEDTIRLIAAQKLHMNCYRGRWLAAGFLKRTRRFIPDFLGPGAVLRFADNARAAGRLVQPGGNIIVWSSRLSEGIQQIIEQKNLRLWRMEDGFLRSVGLGADSVRPISLVIDSSGIYYDSSCPSDLENILKNHVFDEQLLSRAEAVRNQLVSLRLSKYNVGVSASIDLPKNRHVVLVPGQVETDASIVKGSPVTKTNRALLESVRKNNPDSYIVYKPHPDVASGIRRGELNNESEGLYDKMVVDTPITDLFDRVDEIHTMSSLSGFEALLRGLKVVVYGMPFYAGWGLTEDKLICERRNRALSLNELVAAVLILYPVYVEPDSGDVCDVETAIEILHARQGKIQGPSFLTRFYRSIVDVSY